MLEAVGVSKRFGGMTAVDQVSLSVARGEIAGLIGPNGAGKTTMFNLLAGSLTPNGGEIRLEGRAIAAAPAHRRLALGLGRTEFAEVSDATEGSFYGIGGRGSDSVSPGARAVCR